MRGRVVGGAHEAVDELLGVREAVGAGADQGDDGLALGRPALIMALGRQAGPDEAAPVAELRGAPGEAEAARRGEQVVSTEAGARRGGIHER